MKLSPRPVSIGAALLAITACDAPDAKFEKREDRIEAALADNDEIGTFGSPAVWLVKDSSLAANDRTAVFFGYGDNHAACEEFAEAYELKFDAESYSCEVIQGASN